jgi:hypothetical protein
MGKRLVFAGAAFIIVAGVAGGFDEIGRHHPVGSATPNWAEQVTAIGTAILAVGVVLGIATAWFALDQAKQSRTNRNVQIVADLGHRWDDAALIEARELIQGFTDQYQLAQTVGDWLHDPKAVAFDVESILRVPNFFEDVGLLADCGDVDPKIVSRAFGNMALSYWEMWEPAINGHLRSRDPDAYSEFEDLVRRLRAFRAAA